MNRKQRRANSKTQPAPPPGVGDMFARAVQCHREGRLEEAEQLYRRVLPADPRHADSLHRLGVILYQRGQFAPAEDMLRQAIAHNARAGVYHAHLGLALEAVGRLEEAVASCRAAIALEPNLPDLHNNLGVLLLRLGRLEEAADCYRSAIALNPGLPEAHNNLGSTLLALGRPREAETCFQRALQIDPGQAGTFAELALTLSAQGGHAAAMEAIARSLALKETPENRIAFVQCVRELRLDQDAAALRPLLLRALCEGWDRPDDLALVSADLIKHDAAPLTENRLLQALLCRTPNLDLELEQRLAMARRALLQTALDAAENDVDTSLDFYSALAQQCFINEYVFYADDEECKQARALRDLLAAALQSGAAIHACRIAAVAAYFPLSSVPLSGRLLDMSWPAAIEAIVTRQIREPQDEQRLRAAIPQLTKIADSVSRLVQAQYEENPYPRWVQAGSAGAPEDLVMHLRRKFPFAVLESPAARDSTDILVAGCGTGRNAIETAQRFAGARTLAVDLSLASLAHAARKSRDMPQIEYAQADLLELGTLDRRFDLIEAVGVLHHLADPFAGWRVLLSLLKPKGFMMLGLYSAAARRNLEGLRASISGGSHEATAEAVRLVRHALMDAKNSAHAGVEQHPDFFTISTCRDMLFHVQEQCVTLADIKAFLHDHGLKLLGFAIGDAELAAYRRRFPGDPGARDLDLWQEFENDNPDTFSGMYQFWLQKAL